MRAANIRKHGIGHFLSKCSKRAQQHHSRFMQDRAVRTHYLQQCLSHRHHFFLVDIASKNVCNIFSSGLHMHQGIYMSSLMGIPGTLSSFESFESA